MITDATKTRLMLVRHGQTDWNVERRIQGQLDIALNATGMKQARKVAQQLAVLKGNIEALYSSDLQRAIDTAREISSCLEQGIVTHEALREIHAGKTEGLTNSERDRLFGKERRELDAAYCQPDRDNYPDWPGAEPRNHFFQRIYTCVGDIARAHPGGAAIIVTHASVVQTLITHATKESVAIPNCSVVEFDFEHGQEQPLAFIRLQSLELF